MAVTAAALAALTGCAPAGQAAGPMLVGDDDVTGFATSAVESWETGKNKKPVFDFAFWVTNAGKEDLRVTSAGRDMPGLRLEAVALVVHDGKTVGGYDDYEKRPLPKVMKAGDRAYLTMRYRVTDCAAVPKGVMPVPVRVGRAAVWIQPEPLPQVEWQDAMARRACAPPEER